MNRKIVLYIAQSLDGYIARKDDTLDWLFKAEGEGDNGYSVFYDTIDTILIGRRTYDWIMDHEKDKFPYENKSCYVFSRSKHQDFGNVQFVSEDVATFTNRLKAQDGKDIWIVGGGELLLSFIKEKLIDELYITIAPTIIGSGIPLFLEENYELDLILQDVRRYNQFAELHYTVKK